MTTHTRENALDDRQFELLLEGAQRLEKDHQSLEAQFLVLVGGRLGLRAGEIAHLREDWIDWRQRRIDIPRQQDCHLGSDGGVCGYCKMSARQMAANYDADEVSDTRIAFYNRHLADGFQRGDDLTVEDCLEMRWFAKTDAAARSVPFGFDPRTELTIERFFDTGRDGWGLSKTSLNRRLEWALEAADELDADLTTPHGLRGTAASWHAAKGLGVLELQAMFGWASLQTSRLYIKRSADNTERALHSVHSM
jgi:integrase